ncbi:hypothetical protein CK621_02880 [Vandammella animalimorsus]|uniref:Uncharacterized protein n=2 Tax=Vandammella animalimorsus TaxID=2029117 RepID=A0A2A2B0X7_9BURK|nr:hypothetical protein CK621_02880 [Vandammella animalimorsus]
MEDLLNACAARARAMGLPREIRKTQKTQMMLDALRAHGGHHELLLSKADADCSDVSLRTLQSNSRRRAGKAAHEGVEISSHAIVRPNADRRTAALALTMGAGVSGRDVALLLNKLAREAASDAKFKPCFWFDHPSAAKGEDGKPVQYRVRYTFECEAYLGQTLRDALEHGKFQHMELIADADLGMDDGGNLRATKETLTVKAENPEMVTVSSIKNAIGALRKKRAQNFRTLRLHYAAENGRDATAVLAVNDLEQAFTRKAKISLESDVEEYQEKFHPTVIGHLRALMKDVTD